MTPTFALALPHTPWIEERVTSLETLLAELFVPAEKLPIQSFQLFHEKEPNWSWSKKLWAWGARQNVTHVVQLQDDVRVAPNFWNALSAMVTAVPDQIIGLQGAHPKFRALARDEHRWAQSKAWMVGVGWLMPVDVISELSGIRNRMPDDVAAKMNEDDLIASYCDSAKRSVYHPIPTIIDHDVNVASTYGNESHLFRRPTVTWRDFGRTEIEDPQFWSLKGEVPLVTSPHSQRCWGCEARGIDVKFENTYVALCRPCVANSVAAILGDKNVNGVR